MTGQVKHENRLQQTCRAAGFSRPQSPPHQQPVQLAAEAESEEDAELITFFKAFRLFLGGLLSAAIQSLSCLVKMDPLI